MESPFCVFYNDSDGYTYSVSVLMGIFLTHSDAETAVLQHTEAIGAYQARKAEAEAQSNAILDQWRLAKAGTKFADDLWAQYFASKADWEKEKTEVFGGGIDGSSDLEKYEIRQVETGKIFENGA